MKAFTLVYRGSKKHKKRPATGKKGTLCPEWSHRTGAGGLGNDMAAHAWHETEAHLIFRESVEDPEGSGKRFATKNGMAFAAHDTEDGTWHGFPVPWNDVPAVLVEGWRDRGQLRKRDLKTYSDFPKNDVAWPLTSDNE